MRGTEPSAAMMSATPGDWAFGPPDSEIIVRNAEYLLAYLPFFIGGWPFRRLENDPARSPDITVEEMPGGDVSISLIGPGGGPSRFDSPFTGASGLAGTIIAAYTVRHDELVCFHAGTTTIGGRLIAFLGDSGAGKSTLSLQFAAAGYRLFGDDRLAVRLEADGPPQGICLGLMPKARLPLPETSNPRFREFVDGFTEMRSDDTAYLKLWDGEAAGFGEQCPLAAFIVLDRQESGSATLSDLPRPALIRDLLSNSYSPHLDSHALVPRMTALASATPGYSLSYADGEDAIRMIVERFGKIDI